MIPENSSEVFGIPGSYFLNIFSCLNLKKIRDSGHLHLLLSLGKCIVFCQRFSDHAASVRVYFSICFLSLLKLVGGFKLLCFHSEPCHPSR